MRNERNYAVTLGVDCNGYPMFSCIEFEKESQAVLWCNDTMRDNEGQCSEGVLYVPVNEEEAKAYCREWGAQFNQRTKI